MIKKYQILGLALFAVFAFSAVMAVSASAVTFLLAEWLLNGVAVTVLTSTVTSQALLLEDTKVPFVGPVAVLCERLLDGSVGPNGEDEITEVLNAAGEKIELGVRALLCTSETACSAGTAEVYPEKLPWHTSLELEEPGGKFVDLIVTNSAGYDVECTVLGIKQADECEALVGTKSTPFTNGTTSVMLTAGAATPPGNCSLGGAGSEVIEVEGTEGLIEDLVAGTLSVSSV